jgi:hypothetical protein
VNGSIVTTRLLIPSVVTLIGANACSANHFVGLGPSVRADGAVVFPYTAQALIQTEPVDQVSVTQVSGVSASDDLTVTCLVQGGAPEGASGGRCDNKGNKDNKDNKDTKKYIGVLIRTASDTPVEGFVCTTTECNPSEPGDYLRFRIEPPSGGTSDAAPTSSSSLSSADQVTLLEGKNVYIHVTTADQGSEKMLVAAATLANRVLQTDCFQHALERARLTSTCATGNCASMPDANEVLRTLRPSKPVDVNVSLFDGTWWQNHVNRTVGYDSGVGSGSEIRMNKYFIHASRMAASNLLHEYAHVLGYRHRNARESTSVPYTMNRIFEECTSEFFESGGAQ